MASQLRIYAINPGELDEFVVFWRDHVVPARQAHGFRVDGAWTTTDGEFAWIVSHDGDFDSAEVAYYEGPERAAAPRDPKEFIASAQLRMLQPVEG